MVQIITEGLEFRLVFSIVVLVFLLVMHAGGIQFNARQPIFLLHCISKIGFLLHFSWRLVFHLVCLFFWMLFADVFSVSTQALVFLLLMHAAGIYAIERKATNFSLT